MKIDISKHYFGYYTQFVDIESLAGFSIGEIVIDWHGDIGCILNIHKNGDVRTDSNGMGHIGNLKKTRNHKRIEGYLRSLHDADILFLQNTHKRELKELRPI